MARTVTAIRIEGREEHGRGEENVMGRTCLKWQRDGALNGHDLALILKRLCEADSQACAIPEPSESQEAE